MSNRFLLAICMLFVLAACGGDETGGDVADADIAGLTVIESPDGIASIAIDPAGLPEGVSINDVSIIAAVNDTENTELPIMAVRLEPHGTTLSIPATVTMKLPEPDGGIMTIHQSGDYLQFLESTVEVVGESFSVMTEIGSFSTLSHYTLGLDAELSLSPPTVVVDQPQTGLATVTVQERPISFSLPDHFGVDEPRLLTFAMSPPRNVSPGNAGFYWGRGWSPTGTTDAELSEGVAPWTSSPGVSVCKSDGVGTREVHFDLFVHFEIEVLGIESASIESRSMADIFAPSDDLAPRAHTLNNGLAWRGELTESVVGEVWDAFGLVGARTQTQCVAPDDGGDRSDNDSDSNQDNQTAGGNWSTTDPTDDWQEWGGFEPIKPERTADGVNAGDAMAAGDITSLEVSSEGSTTTVDLRFGGDAQAMEAFFRSDFSGQIVITLEDGTRWEVIFKDEGGVKIVSGASGMSVTREWVQGDRLRLTITGLTVGPGAGIEATVQLGLFDGSSQDTASLDI